MDSSPKFSIIGIIPARYGSTRFPGKILKKIAGKTLIQRTFENAKKCQLLNELIVATDDDRIANHVESFGGRAIMTSINCPTGTDRIVEAVQKTPDLQQADIVVNIQGDEPCLEEEVITKVIQALEQDEIAVMSTAAVPIHSKEEAVDPNVVKCVIDQQGHALYFSRGLIPYGREGTFREDITYYRHMGIYGFKKEFLIHYASLTPTPLQQIEGLEQLRVLEHGYPIHVSIVSTQSIGVDTPEDLKKVEKLL